MTMVVAKAMVLRSPGAVVRRRWAAALPLLVAVAGHGLGPDRAQAMPNPYPAPDPSPYPAPYPQPSPQPMPGQSLLFPAAGDGEALRLVKAADKLCAYLKCLEELKAGNQEFSQAKAAIERELGRLDSPEVAYFLEKFAPSFSLTLDE